MKKYIENALIGLFFAVAGFIGFGFYSDAHAQVNNPTNVGPAGKPKSFTAHGVLIGQGTSNVAATSAGTSGLCLVSGGSSADPSWASCSTGSGTVTSVSVTSANGLAGTVANATTTPAITLTTSVNGVVKGNGTSFSAASAGTDYAPPTSGSAILKGNGAGGFASATSGTDYAPPTSGSSILYGNGAGGFSNVTIGTGLSFSGGTLNNTGASGVSVVNGYISGFTLSNDGASPNTILDVASGFAADSSNAVMISGTAFKKTTGGAWVAGSNNAGMGAGLTVAANTWYHVFAIINNGSYDVYFDTSITAANKPTNTTAVRYIGSFKTDASSNILAFIQQGQYFYWAAQVQDLTNGAATTATLVALSVPPGFSTFPLFTVADNAANNSAWVWSPLSGSTAPAAVIVPNGALISASVSQFATNSAAQIYYKISSNNLNIYTTGYINPKVSPTN